MFFHHRQHCGCEVFIDDADLPCFVVVILQDKELVATCGSDVTLKTDLQQLLPRRYDMPELVELRKTIFATLQNTPRLFRKKKNGKRTNLFPQMLPPCCTPNCCRGTARIFSTFYRTSSLLKSITIAATAP